MVGRDQREYWYRWISRKNNNGQSTPGCMSGMLHLLDFHHILFTRTTTAATTRASTALHDHDDDDDDELFPADQLRGVEAPRNSLELLHAEDSSCNLADLDYSGGNPKNKKKKKDLRSLVEEEKRSSTKLAESTPPHTPSVVARLMGLNISPDEDSPKFTIKMSHSHRRQPLQRMDGNIILQDEPECRSLPETPKASSNKRDKYNVDRGYSLPPSPPTYMNKHRVGENKRPSSQYYERSPPSLSPPTPPPPQHRYFPPKLQRPLQVGFFRAERQNFDDKTIISTGSRKLKNDWYERRFTERVRKQTPPSAEPPSSSSSSLSSIKIRSIQPTKRRSEAFYQTEACTATRQVRDSKEQDPEFLYVRSVLQCAGITCTSRVRWYSPSLPIDPYVFHQLEHHLPFLFGPIKAQYGPLRHHCNRKLLFHLVQDLLIDLPTWPSTNKTSNPFIERLWSQIQGFPLANCQVIGDIDALVAGDLAEAKVRGLLCHPSLVAEAEGMVFEIEREVFDSIIGEAAASLALSSKC